MDNKQTAVQWLLNILTTENEITLKGENYKLFDMAIRMEKEQILDAYYRGGEDTPLTDKECEEYYNETYGGNNKTQDLYNP